MPNNLTNFPEVRKLWSGVDITNFGTYYEALQARLIDRIWNDEPLKQEILTNPKVVFERKTGITFYAGLAASFVLPYRARASEDYIDAVVIGSGFGGAIAALRLGQCKSGGFTKFLTKSSCRLGYSSSRNQWFKNTFCHRWSMLVGC